MRFVPTSCLRSGMVLGRDLFGHQNELMLSEGQELSHIEIFRIKKLRYQGAFIEDEISKDIEVQSVLSTTLKNSAVRAVKAVCFQLETDGGPDTSIYQLKMVAEEIVDEITQNNNAMINMIDLKVFDDYTYYHSVNVAALSILIGATMGLAKKNLCMLGLGALLHDIGKIFIAKEILDKPGKLTAAELEEIRTHSRLGSEYLTDRWEVPVESNMAVLTHHEYYDGTGYPNGLKGNEIPQFGKIVAVSDVFDALTSDRPYRRQISPSEAIEFVMGGSGSQFDPGIVKTFVKKIVPYPVGTCVNLSNGQTGIVIKNFENYGMRPQVKIISSQGGEIYDLCNNRELLNVTITGIAQI